MGGTSLGELSGALRCSQECAKTRAQCKTVQGEPMIVTNCPELTGGGRTKRDLSRARGGCGDKIEKRSASTEVSSRANHSRQPLVKWKRDVISCPGLPTGTGLQSETQNLG